MSQLNPSQSSGFHKRMNKKRETEEERKERYRKEDNKLDLQNEPSRGDEAQRMYDREQEEKERKEKKYYDEGILGTDAEHKARINKAYMERKWDKKLSYKGEPNQGEVDELRIYTDNDYDTYKNHTEPTEAMLVKKMKKGSYSPKGGDVAFLNVVQNSSRKYDKENNSPHTQTFSKADKVATAKEMARNFEDEYKLGNYN